MKPLDKLIRPNILKLKPYRCARNEFTGHAEVLLDANENPYNEPYNRYPDPYQKRLKSRLSEIKGVDVSHIFIGNGSDEPIDLVYRIFCEPGVHNAVAIAPTYGMYRVAADINGVEYREVMLRDDFSLDVSALLSEVDEHTRLLFLCSPNNPTGNSLDAGEIEAVLRGFDGLVVLDEAYIDFSSRESFIGTLAGHPNLVVLQTFSKAWGCAAIRLGMAFASPDIVAVLNKIKYPYNVNELTQRHALEMLYRYHDMHRWVATLKEERHYLEEKLRGLRCVVGIYPSDANFILVHMTDAPRLYDYLVARGIIVRNRHTALLCGNCLRITVGTRVENDMLLEALAEAE